MIELQNKLTPERRALLALRLRQKNGLSNPASELVRRAQSPAALSHGQRSIWLKHQLGDDPTLNFQMAFRLRGALDVEGLRWSVEQVVRRHEILRSRFVLSNENPVQEALAPKPWELAVEDASGDADEVLRKAVQPFNLEKGEVLRTRLVRLRPDEHLFIVSLHHIAVDGWSSAILVRELSMFYSGWRQGAEVSLPPLEIQYADYAAWDNERLKGERLERLEEFWKQQLDGVLPLDLPTDFPRPLQLKYVGARETTVVGRDLTARMRALSREAEASLFMTLLAVWQAVLSLWSGQKDLVAATFVADRGLPKIQDLIGFFVNTVLLRVDLAGNPAFSELLARVKKTALAAYSHKDLSIEHLLDKIQASRDLNRTNLLQNVFGLQTVSSQFTLAGLDIEPVKIPKDTVPGEVSLQVYDNGQEMTAVLEYSSELWTPATAQQLMRSFVRALVSVADNPHTRVSELLRFSEDERRRVAEKQKQTSRAYAEKTILDHFEVQVERTPDAVAIVTGDQTITYRALCAEADRIAHYLVQSGVRPGDIVAICVGRGPGMLSALLGVLKAGAAYLPLHPDNPVSRIEYMLRNSGARLIIADRQVARNLGKTSVEIVWWDDFENYRVPRHSRIGLPGADVSGLAYVIYTSGSTGEPKGVMVPHLSLTNAMHAFVELLALGPEDTTLALTALSFDIAGLELFAPLFSGGRITIVPERVRSDGPSLKEFITKAAPTLIQATPSTFEVLKAAGWQAQKGVRVLSGGEPLQSPLAEHLIESGSDLWNMYGPTETTIWSSAASLSKIEHGIIPIGSPLANTQVYVLDEDGEPVQEGRTGEIVIGGAGLAWGYRNQPSLTATAFIPDSLSGCVGGRLYRTGDFGRWNADGQLEFIGRRDNQVKIRGHRIELGEIETVLKRQPGIASCAVMVHSEELLVAYVVLSGGAALPEWAELQATLAKDLPRYMLPNAIVPLAAMPLLPSGKIDRRALKYELAAPIQRRSYVPPKTELEKLIASAWAEVLRVERVGTEDNFFELGGHSLLATQVISRIRQVFGVELPLRTLFDAPTVKGLAETLEHGTSASVPPLARADRNTELPLSYAQQRLWFLQQLDPRSTAYNIAFEVQLNGALNAQALKESLNEIVRRHEVLRTSFPAQQGKPVQKIAPKMTLAIDEIDLRALSGEEQEAQVRSLTRESAGKPFNLSQGPLLRIKLLRIQEQEYVLLVCMHHIVSDGWSSEIMLRELTQLYQVYANGERPKLEDLKIQYADFAVWQRGWLQGKILEEQLRYWRSQLDGIQPLVLPTDRPRPAVKNHSGAVVNFILEPELTQKLKQFAQREGITLFMSLLTAFNLMLSKYSGQRDITVGAAIANRNRLEIEGLIGFFVNTLILRTKLDLGMQFRELLKQVRQTTLDAYRNQDVPFEKLVEERRELDRTALFQVMIIFQSVPFIQNEMHGLSLSTRTADDAGVRSDLDLYLTENPDAVMGRIVYDPELFDTQTVERMMGEFHRLLESIVESADHRISELMFSSPRQFLGAPSLSASPVKKLSYHQERMWFIDRFESGVVYEGSPVYHNIPLVVRFREEIHTALLEQSLNEVLARHAALRTTLVQADGKAMQKVQPALRLELERRRVELDCGDEQQVFRIVQAVTALPFALEGGPLIRATLAECGGAQGAMLIVVAHHSIADRFSMRCIVKELAEIYSSQQSGVQARLPEIGIQYPEFGEWQRELGEEAWEDYWLYWKNQMLGERVDLKLPWKCGRHPVHVYRSGVRRFAIGREVIKGLEELCQDEQMSLEEALLGCFYVLLHLYSGQQEFLVGVPERNRGVAGTESTVGAFSNLLVVGERLQGRRLGEWVKEMADRLREARKYSELPFDLLVQKVKPVLDMSRTALFDVLFDYEECGGERLGFGGATGEVVESNLGFGKYDLNLLVEDCGEELKGHLVYNQELYEERLVEQMAEHYKAVVEELVRTPQRRVEEVAVLSAVERRLQLEGWNETAAEYAGEKTLMDLFEEQVEATGERVAVSCGAEQLSYAELNERAEAVAEVLRKQGVGADTLVGICMERNLGMVVAIVGVLKAGGGYLPMDPVYPDERLRFMVKDAGVQHVIAGGEAEAERFMGALNATEAMAPSEPTEPMEPTKPLEPVEWCVVVGAGGEVEQVRQVHGAGRAEKHNPVSESEPGNLAYCIYTSGSTGRPNGVLVEHRQVVRLMKNSRFAFAVSEKDVWTLFHSYCFDFSVWELWGALLYGGRLVVVPREVTRDPRAFVELLRREKVTVLNQTPPSFYNVAREAVEQGGGELALRYVIFGGEALQPAYLKEWKRAYPTVKLVNMYGITETTVHVTVREVEERDIEEGRSNIGVPIPTTRTYILNQEMEPVPVGVTGEIYVGGEGLARGYANRGQLTASRFVPDPLGGEAGRRLYRTGDLGRYHWDGSIEYMGRMDQQVKIRGYRIELGEIEAQLAECEGVAEGVVLVLECVPGEQRLVAYYTIEKGIAEQDAPGAEVLRGYLSRRLADYMVPAEFVRLERLPLTENGKLDRKALPRPDSNKFTGCAYDPPLGELETAIAGIWAEVLQVERISRHDNFFKLGGHSLSAVRLVGRIKQELQIDVSVRQLFEAPSVAVLAEQLRDTAKRSDQSMDSIVPVPHTDAVPLSYGQHQLWVVHQFNPGSSAYHIPSLFHLHGNLNTDILERSFSEIVRRHEILRTSFPTRQGQPVQCIEAPRRLLFPLVDVTTLPTDERALALERLIDQDGKQPFDLASGPLIRFLLVRLGVQHHALLITLHHIIADGWSIPILVRELTVIYSALVEGKPNPLVDLPIQYADYALWLSGQRRSEAFQRSLQYWRDRLTGTPVLKLPCEAAEDDKPAEGAVRGTSIPAAMLQGLHELCEREGCTLFMALLACWQVLLARYCDQTDIAIGAPVANRPTPDLYGLIGYFVNTVVLRTDLSGDPSFNEVLQRVRTAVLDAHTHEQIPFEYLVAELKPPRQPGQTPFFRAVFTFGNFESVPYTLSFLRIQPQPVHKFTAKFDLELSAAEHHGSVDLRFIYKPQILGEGLIQRMLDDYFALLRELVERPSSSIQEVALCGLSLQPTLLEKNSCCIQQHETPVEQAPDLVTPGDSIRKISEDFAANTTTKSPDASSAGVEELERFLVEYNRTETEYENKCFHELFEEQVKRTPQETAVLFGEESITYQELNERANQLAHYLREQGVGPEKWVGLCLERAIEMVVAMLGVLKAGGGYVPLDPGYPQERLAYMLKDAAPGLVVGVGQPLGFREVFDLQAHQNMLKKYSTANLERATDVQNLAFLIYTSGSTGAPKGVAISHAALTNHMQWMSQTFAISSGDRVLQKAPISFDASVTELCLPLMTGATLVLAKPGGQQDSSYLVNLIIDQKITVAQFVPSLLEFVVREKNFAKCTTLKYVLTGAEPLPRKLAAQVHDALGLDIMNLYGPTEVTIDAVFCQVKPGHERVMVGKPIGNMRAYVLDDKGQPVPAGEAGEIYIGGVQLARGYWARPELTAERFIPDAVSGKSGERLYRTGDLGRWGTDGELECLGRCDDQIKIRGCRVEKGEIETLLRRYPGVTQAAVRLWRDTDGQNHLVAYIVGASTELTARQVRRDLANSLPEYMLPSHIMFLQAAPLTPSGKLDTRSLPLPHMSSVAEENAGGQDHSIESIILCTWQQVLVNEEIGLDDNFFEAGGNSFLLLQARQKLCDELAINISVPDMLRFATVRALSEALKAGLQAETSIQ